MCEISQAIYSGIVTSYALNTFNKIKITARRLITPLVHGRAAVSSLYTQDDSWFQNGDVEMEITWGGVDLKEKTEELVKKKEQEKDLTPWEKYIEKQKTKKRAKSAAQKEAAKAVSVNNWNNKLIRNE